MSLLDRILCEGSGSGDIGRADAANLYQAVHWIARVGKKRTQFDNSVKKITGNNLSKANWKGWRQEGGDLDYEDWRGYEESFPDDEKVVLRIVDNFISKVRIQYFQPYLTRMFRVKGREGWFARDWERTQSGKYPIEQIKMILIAWDKRMQNGRHGYERRWGES